jgi:transcriptional regulator with XRE-family HTH domain
MLYIAENLRMLRKSMGLTQEEIAEMLCVSPQSVSKWERGDTYPDIALLPALANLFKTSVDALIGMDKINDMQARTAIFETEHILLRKGDFLKAAAVLEEALKTFPNDESLMSELALALAFDSDEDKLKKSVQLCLRVLSGNPTEKVRHTTRAALCFIYMKTGDRDKAKAIARNLPHARESREAILALLEKEISQPEIDAYLKFIAVGEQEEQDIICIDFGTDMIPLADNGLIQSINALRDAFGQRAIPKVRIRDNICLKPKQVRLRYYAEYLMDEEFLNAGMAAEKILLLLRELAEGK